MKKSERILFLIIDIVFGAALVFLDQYKKKLATLNLMGKEPWPEPSGYLTGRGISL